MHTTTLTLGFLSDARAHPATALREAILLSSLFPVCTISVSLPQTHLRNITRINAIRLYAARLLPFRTDFASLIRGSGEQYLLDSPDPCSQGRETFRSCRRRKLFVFPFSHCPGNQLKLWSRDPSKQGSGTCVCPYLASRRYTLPRIENE